MSKNLINHKNLGGDVVDVLKIPQRKPNSSMSGEELLAKAVLGTHKPKEKDIWQEKGLRK